MRARGRDCTQFNMCAFHYATVICGFFGLLMFLLFFFFFCFFFFFGGVLLSVAQDWILFELCINFIFLRHVMCRDRLIVFLSCTL